MAYSKGESEDGEEMEVGEQANSDSCHENTKREVYLPGKPMDTGEELTYDPSAYHMLHSAATGAPCLSFDVVPDKLGENREFFPHTAYIVAGTQAERANGNSIIVMKLSNMHKTNEEEEESSSDDSSTDSEDETEKNMKSLKEPKMDKVLIKHHGCINRIRCCPLGEGVVCAVWSELGKVSLVEIGSQLSALDLGGARAKKSGVGEPIRPMFVFSGHQTEGYGIDWSPMVPGMLATGDCKKNIHVWRPSGSGTWHVDQMPLVGHEESVEDLQWSPNEPNVLASCSVDKSLRIWDTREAGSKACKLTVKDAHLSDINVISWNRKEPLILSGGDDGFLHIWDLRNFKKGEAVASLKHHTDSVTTVEWHPTESTVFASGGADDQIALWDLALERDDAEEMTEDVKNLPPQLLFIHQGQEDIKELHWHAQIPGMVISTANSGFNFFKTISV